MKYIPICLSPAALLNLFEGDHGAPPDVLVLLLTTCGGVDEYAGDRIALDGSDIVTPTSFSAAFGIRISIFRFSFDVVPLCRVLRYCGDL